MERREQLPGYSLCCSRPTCTQSTVYLHLRDPLESKLPCGRHRLCTHTHMHTHTHTCTHTCTHTHAHTHLSQTSCCNCSWSMSKSCCSWSCSCYYLGCSLSLKQRWRRWRTQLCPTMGEGGGGGREGREKGKRGKEDRGDGREG